MDAKVQGILDKHKKWLDGEGGERADLRSADLYKADLYGANLRRADLCEADLRWADLRWANLREANLREAYLREANLRGARLLYLDGNIGRHRVFAAGGHIIIGCERHTYEHWLEHGEEIGRANEYSDTEIARYMTWIRFAAEMLTPLEAEIAEKFDAEAAEVSE